MTMFKKRLLTSAAGAPMSYAALKTYEAQAAAAIEKYNQVHGTGTR